MKEDNSFSEQNCNDQNLFDFPELKGFPSLATASEVARFLKCSKRHVLNECHAGRMTHALIAGRFLITPKSVKNYIQERIQPSRKAMEEPNSIGLKGINRVSPSNSQMDTFLRNQRALEIATKLTKRRR